MNFLRREVKREVFVAYAVMRETISSMNITLGKSWNKEVTRRPEEEYVPERWKHRQLQ
jgi:hypothetical protein